MQNSRYQTIDSYAQKIAYQASQIESLQNSILQAKIRMRSAEDLNIRYQLIIKQLQQDKKEIMSVTKNEQSKIAQLINIKTAERDRYWSQKVTQLQSQIQKHYENKILVIKQQFENKQNRQTSRSQKQNSNNNKFEDLDIVNFKCKKLQKQNQHLQETIVNMKIQLQAKQQRQKNNIRQALQRENKQKQQNQRNIYRQKIEQLTLTITQLKTKLQQTQLKVNPQRQKAIQVMKKEISTMNQQTNKQIQTITAYFSQKNEQLKREQIKRSQKEDELMKQQKLLRGELKKVEAKLFDQQRQNSEQVLAIKEKMSKIRQEEINSMKSQLQYHQDAIRNQRTKWDKIIEDKDMELQRVINKAQDDKQRHTEDRVKLKNKIDDLKQRVRHYQNQEGNDTINFMQSLKQLEIKQADFASYQNSVTFLSRQLKKALLKVEQKNIQITRLLKQLNSIREENDNEQSSIKNKLKKDRSYYSSKISDLQSEIKNLNEQIRKKDKEIKRKEKIEQSSLNQIKIENKSLKQMIEQMQKDYTRILGNKKATQNMYQSERQKSFASKTDLTMVKKQKWFQLERQKSELDVMFKEKQEQMRIKFEVQRERLRHERDQIKAQLQKSRAAEQLADVNGCKKQNKLAMLENKENIRKQFEAKIATLELQIALTENIHNSLIKSESRNKEMAVEQRDFEKISEQISESQNQGNTLLTSPRYQFEGKDQKMVFSFNPKDI